MALTIWAFVCKGSPVIESKGNDFRLPKIESVYLYEGSICGNQCKKLFPMRNFRRATECLELVLVELCGPMTTQSFDGSKYFFIIHK